MSGAEIFAGHFAMPTKMVRPSSDHDGRRNETMRKPVGKSVARALLAEGVALAAFADLDPRKIGQRVYGVPVLASAEACRMVGGPFGIGAVGQPGAREELRATLRAAGWVEGRDFRCAA